ncbi:MAG TPA: LysR family transcriptional regulator, partial [Steroidobacteraceae bacterium]|nr:LysR family transcriptional regulator [Steroidobacteraceae bacterium]
MLRTGSLSAAGRALRLTQPTVGRHIASLEQRLGGRALFTRHRSGLLPTETAVQLRPYAESIAAAAGALLRAASAKETAISGAVRISASEVMGTEVLPALVSDFRERHPGVVVELSLSNQTADLLRRDADIAVRMVRPTQKALVARRIGKTVLGLHASRKYVEAHGVPGRIEELDRHPLIGFDSAPSVSRPLNLPPAIRRDRFAFRCDSDLGQLAAIRAGFGIGVCQYGIAIDPPLVSILPRELRFELEMWVVMHEVLRTTARVKL